MGSAPQIRAFLVKGLIDTIERQPEGSAILERVPEALLATARAAPAVGWLSLEAHMGVCRALCDVRGEVGFRAHYRKFVYTSLDMPVLGPLITTALHSFGHGPTTLFRIAPRVALMTSRGVASIRADVSHSDAQNVQLEWYDICPAARVPLFATLQEAFCLAMLDLGHGMGDAEADASGLADGRLVVAASWAPSRPTPVPAAMSSL